MANTQKPNYPQILELPAGLTADQAIHLISDRIKDLNLLIKGLAINPAVVDLSMANFRITQLADPTDDLDAVNLRTLRRGAGAPASTTSTTTSAAGVDAYTIVTEGATTLGDGDVAPAYIVGADRAASPEEAWFYAESAPLVDAAINWQVQLGGSGSFTALLAHDLVLPAGSFGPIFSTDFALRATFPHGTVVKMVVTTGGSAGLASAGVVMKRS